MAYLKCSQCQHQNDEGAKFCNQCAALLSDTAVRSQTAVDASQESIISNFKLAFSRLSIGDKLSGLGLILIVFLFFAISLVSNKSSDSNYQGLAQRQPQASTAPAPSTSSTPSTPYVPSPDYYLQAARNVLSAPLVLKEEVEIAKDYLEKIPTTAPEYKEASTLLRQIKTGKIGLPDIPGFESQSKKIYEAATMVDRSVTYAKLKKNADKYYGTIWAFTGKVLEIYEGSGGTVARVGVGSWGLDAIFVEGDFTTDFVEKDSVYVIGDIRGTKTYESQAGWTINIPQVKAFVMLKPSVARRLQSLSSKNK